MAFVRQSQDITGVDPTTFIRPLVVRGKLLEKMAIGQVVEMSPRQELAETRELNPKPLADPSSDRLVKAVCAALAIWQPLRLAPRCDRALPHLVVELAMCVGNGGADDICCFNNSRELVEETTRFWIVLEKLTR